MRKPSHSGAWVRARCSNCGTVTVPVGRTALGSEAGDGAVCRVFCYCGAVTDVPVDDRTIELLVAAGAPTEAGKPITEDEIARFAAALDTCNIVEEARSGS